MVNTSLENSTKAENSCGEFPWLVFLLHSVKYAINCRYVTSILEKPDKITPIVNSPDFVLGIINIREDIIPLVDMAVFFKITNRTIEQQNNDMVIMLHNKEETTGFRIDGVLAVENLKVITQASERETLKNFYLYGIGTQNNDVNQEIILMLDDERLIDDVLNHM